MAPLPGCRRWGNVFLSPLTFNYRRDTLGPPWPGGRRRGPAIPTPTARPASGPASRNGVEPSADRTSMPAPQASRTSAADPAIARRRPVQGRQPRPVRRVHVRAALQKRLHRTGGVVKKRRRVQRCGPIGRPRVDVRPVVEQTGGGGSRRIAHRHPVQGRLARGVLGAKICPVTQQRRHYPGGVLQRRHVQGSHAVVRPRADVRPVVEQHLRYPAGVLHGRHVQRRRAVLGPRAGLGAAVEQEGGRRHRVARRGPMQRGIAPGIAPAVLRPDIGPVVQQHLHDGDRVPPRRRVQRRDAFAVAAPTSAPRAASTAAAEPLWPAAA